jgi:outer membrane protein assembly factor BamB
MKKTLIILILVLSQLSLAADWPRFLGPAADSISPEGGINKNWNQTAPTECWRVPLTDEGFSGPAVKGNVVYLHDHQGEEDMIRALDLADGEEKWRFAYAEAGDENDGFTRATPTIDNGQVYTISRTGVVHCLDAASGQKKWRADVMQAHGGEPPKWGAANSAFIDGNQLITIGAGENSHVVALDKQNGEKIWAGGGTDIAGYGTPVLAEFGGQKQYLVFTGKSIISVAAADGTLLWRHPWKTQLNSNACAPIVVDENLVWIASGYRRGCALLSIKDNQVTELWKDKRISPSWSSAVQIDGHIYVTTMPGYLVCVEARTGKEKWRDRGTARGFEHGGLCAVDGTLIVIEGNTGTVVQVAVSSEAYEELGRISPFKSSRCWVAPVVAQKRLLVRSPKELVCLDIGQ